VNVHLIVSLRFSVAALAVCLIAGRKTTATGCAIDKLATNRRRYCHSEQTGRSISAARDDDDTCSELVHAGGK
jgi:hypothetical protein